MCGGVRHLQCPLSGRVTCVIAAAVCLAAQDSTQGLLHRAQDDLAAGRYAAAIRNGAAALPSFRAAGDRSSAGLTLTVIGLAQLYSGQYEAALHNLMGAVEISHRTGDVESEVTRMCDVGAVLFFEARYAEAMQWYQRAQQRVSAFPNDKWSASRRQFVEGNIAVLFQAVGQFERALDIYSELLGSGAALPPREQAQLLANMGTLQRRLGDPVKALASYRKAQALYRQAEHRD